MKKIITVFVSIITLVSCNSNDDQVNPIDNVSKKLKSIKTSTSGRTYEYGENNFINRENFYYGNDGIVGTLDYVYNSKNQITEVNQQNKNKQVDGTFRNFVRTVTYKYDNNGLISSSSQYYKYQDETDCTRIETAYEYSNSTLVKKLEETTDVYDNVSMVHTFYTYENNRLESTETKIFENGAYIPGSVIVNLKYDSSINPEYKLFPENFLKINPLINANNIISYLDNNNPNASYDAIITYDKDNFPEKILRNYGSGSKFEYLYEYE
ncbi:hypothetical protein P3875_11570 [Myroides sp. JBRI-B21084]|uniref:hypothetical protein n=1 Tax=Myroides sp. JBRI-B21084 TaxID=3119977 RepID=UPI0026E1399A|nr:hypothetical protein [Paenimyroides cloacae]WKW46396.1 hypothetical protein P3875_11570 [Paenimyroides cloacae]